MEGGRDVEYAVGSSGLNRRRAVWNRDRQPRRSGLLSSPNSQLPLLCAGILPGMQL
jgi:hypothetical protein